MRPARRSVLFVTTLLALAAAVIPASPAAAAVGDLVCTASSMVTYSPGLTLTPSTQTITYNINYSGCTSTTGATVASGNRSGTATLTRSCLTLTPSIAFVNTVTWDDATTSTVSGTATEAYVAGQIVYGVIATVTAGRFNGDSVVESLAVSSLNLLACATTGVTSETGIGVVTFA
jgi:hypothetical protein